MSLFKTPLPRVPLTFQEAMDNRTQVRAEVVQITCTPEQYKAALNIERAYKDRVITKSHAIGMIKSVLGKEAATLFAAAL